MRSWIPWSLLVTLVVLAVTGAVFGATTNVGAPTHEDLVSPSFTPAGNLNSGYLGIENFCAVAPLTGNVHYDGASSVFRVNVGGLPPDEDVFVNWANNSVRAPVIADFATDWSGNAKQTSVNLFRLGEVKGVAIVLSTSDIFNQVLGRLEPC